MSRATICVAVDLPEEVEAAEEWIRLHRSELALLSDNYGCGCCVDIYDLEGPAAVLATISEQITSVSDWTRGAAKHGRQQE